MYILYQNYRHDLIKFAKRHEDDPINKEHAISVSLIMQHVYEHFGWDELVQIIVDCEAILQRAYHPLPEWVELFEKASGGTSPHEETTP